MDGAGACITHLIMAGIMAGIIPITEATGQVTIVVTGTDTGIHITGAEVTILTIIPARIGVTDMAGIILTEDEYPGMNLIQQTNTMLARLAGQAVII